MLKIDQFDLIAIPGLINECGKWRPTNRAKINVFLKGSNRENVQSDSGANRIVTDDLTNLNNVWFNHFYYMFGRALVAAHKAAMMPNHVH